MDLQNNGFSKIESVKSKKITFIAKAAGVSIFVCTILGVISFDIMMIESEKLSVELKFFSVALSIMLLSFLGYFVVKDTIIMRKNKITKVVVDQNGLHHYKDETIIESLTFESLYPSPDLKNYDIVLSDGEDVRHDICVYYFDNSRNTVIYKAIIFNTPFSIRNGKELQRHFIKGVLKFRPDLKISPGVFDLLNLKKS